MCIRPKILYATRLISRYMETPTTAYLKGIISFGLWFSTSNDYKLVGYNDSDRTGDEDDRKGISRFFFHGEHNLHLLGCQKSNRYSLFQLVRQNT